MKQVTAVSQDGPYMHYEYDDGSHMVVERGFRIAELKPARRAVTWFFWAVIGAYAVLGIFVLIGAWS